MREGKHFLNIKRNKPRPATLVLALCLLAATSFATVTAARYVGDWTPDAAQADAQAFYFTSDLLTSGDAPLYKLADFVPGTGSDSSKITFQLRNFADDLRVSECDIGYKVTAIGGNVTQADGTITQNGKAATVNLSVPDDAFTNGKARITVTAAATSPYTQTLTAVFELYQHLDSCNLTVHDSANSNTLTLMVTTEDSAGSVNINYPSGVLPDRTDSRLTNITASSVTINVNSDSQYSFVFFKTKPSQVFSNTNFTIN